MSKTCVYLIYINEVNGGRGWGGNTTILVVIIVNINIIRTAVIMIAILITKLTITIIVITTVKIRVPINNNLDIFNDVNICIYFSDSCGSDYY